MYAIQAIGGMYLASNIGPSWTCFVEMARRYESAERAEEVRKLLDDWESCRVVKLGEKWK